MLIDITRLMRRMLSTALSGVDRVELAYARRYIVEGDAEACVRFRSHFAVIARPATLRFLSDVDALWTDAGRRRSDQALLRFEAAIGASPSGNDLGRERTARLRRAVFRIPFPGQRGDRRVAPGGEAFPPSARKRASTSMSPIPASSDPGFSGA